MSNKAASNTQDKLYFPQLDSIRGMSFLAIFCYHAFHFSQADFPLAKFIVYLYDNLPLAIDVFFILSSFLLTYLALSEYKKRGNFSFKNYFTRRILRIWPLYFFILLLAFLLFPFIANRFGTTLTLPNSLYYIFFIANFYTIDHVFFLKFLWTISVEEQFYLFWGFCLRMLHNHLKGVTAILFFISVGSSAYSIITHTGSYYSTLTYLFDFAAGGIAAIWTFTNSRFIAWLQKMSKGANYLFYFYLIFHFILFYFLEANSVGRTRDFISLINRYVFILYISAFIIEQMVSPSRIKIFAKSRFLILTGKLSYGLYCFHGITITFVNLLFQHFKMNVNIWLLVLIYFSLNYFIAAVSYKYLELPFLKLKTRWRRV
ncbi:MAG: acyltransferase [Ginsengibacter sp.]